MELGNAIRVCICISYGNWYCVWLNRTEPNRVKPPQLLPAVEWTRDVPTYCRCLFSFISTHSDSILRDGDTTPSSIYTRYVLIIPSPTWTRWRTLYTMRECPDAGLGTAPTLACLSDTYSNSHARTLRMVTVTSYHGDHHSYTTQLTRYA